MNGEEERAVEVLVGARECKCLGNGRLVIGRPRGQKTRMVRGRALQEACLMIQALVSS
jgi:hypothetical protein